MGANNREKVAISLGIIVAVFLALQSPEMGSTAVGVGLA
jgi:hypothetical protein